eukprot:m.50134 g.50134  ORF g.50134 m.50134 type:complete len:515 (-) comp11136_c0_seq1:339-1883(-)
MLSLQDRVCLVLAVVVVGLCAVPSEGAKVVAFAFPYGTSHHMVLAKVGRELVARGHEFVLVRTTVDEPDKVDTTGLTIYTVKSSTAKQEMRQMMIEMATMTPAETLDVIVKQVFKNCMDAANDPELLKLVKSADLSLVDPNYACSPLMASYAGVPEVHISPTNFYDPFVSEIYGVPSSPSTVPVMGTRLTPEMTFPERITNTITWFVNYIVRFYVIEPSMNEVRAKLGMEPGFYAHFPNAASAIIYQTTFSLEYPRLITPNAHLVGPILPEPFVPFKDQEVAKVFENTKNGVVLASFGTIAQLTESQAQIIADVLSSLDYDVIWKFNGDVKPKVKSNVLFRDWIEQNNILAHPKTKLFVAHGGANGVLEAAYHGVPLAGFALFGDQWDNIMRTVYRGFGVIIEKDSLTQEYLLDRITSLLNDPKAVENARQVADALRIGKATATEKSADIIEWAIKHGAERRTDLYALNLPWYVQANLDVLATLAAVALLFLWGVFALFRKLLCGGKKPAVKRD